MSEQAADANDAGTNANTSPSKSKQKRVNFSPSQTALLFKAVSQVNPYGEHYKARGAAWEKVAEITRTELGEPFGELTGKTCQEKVSGMIRKYETQGEHSFSSRWSEEDIVAISSTFDQVIGKKRAYDLESAMTKEGKAKVVLNQEKAGARITREAISRRRNIRPQASRRGSDASEHDSGATKCDPDESAHSDNPPGGSPLPHLSPLSPSSPQRSARSRRSSPLPSEPIDITRALKHSLNSYSVNEGQRFERGYEQATEQTQLMGEQVKTLKGILTATERIATALELLNPPERQVMPQLQSAATSAEVQTDDAEPVEPVLKRARFE